MKPRILLYLALGLAAGCGGDSAVDDSKLPGSAADTYIKLGTGYLRMKKYPSALAKLQKALEIDPDNPEVHAALAVLYGKTTQKTELVEAHFKKALYLAPNNSFAHINYGSFLCQQNRPAEAERHFLKAVENQNYKKPELAYTNAGICSMRESKPDKAEKYFKKALATNKEVSDALYYMAELQYEKGYYPEAQHYIQRYYTHLEQFYPASKIHTPETLWLRVRIERALGNKNQEAGYAMFLRSRFPESDQALLLREELIK
ncbi:MAG: type IV pilus biogenesis/stability protein PilW [Gammaproteobacteria bacterium]|nr:type IV pilus biogenesis/stability protein PilW [Gammaproteobacteria bacterium]